MLRFVIFKFNQEREPLKFGQRMENIIYLNKKKIFPHPCSDQNALISFFNDDVLKPPSSKFHMLITWGHGAGLGYFSSIPMPVQKQKTTLLEGRGK